MTFAKSFRQRWKRKQPSLPETGPSLPANPRDSPESRHRWDAQPMHLMVLR